MPTDNSRSWLILIHQIPPKPDYFRVKIWRRLQKIGAVAIKQSVYVLPDNEQAYEDLLWIVKEINQGGGSASLSRTLFLEGISDTDIHILFQTARSEDYRKLTEEVQSVIKEVQNITDDDTSQSIKSRKEYSRLQRRHDEIVAIDFFKSPEEKRARDILAECKALFRETQISKPQAKLLPGEKQGKTWVTRQGIYADRIGCAWLIKRFIDPKAKFHFVADEKYHPGPNELRFDMFDAEYTHEGDKCSFEVLVNTFYPGSEAITAIGEIIHDIDLKDKHYGRPETEGIQALFTGLTATCTDNMERLARGTTLLDELYAYFSKLL